MSPEELIEFLRENLSIVLTSDFEYNYETKHICVAAEIRLNDQLISESSTYFVVGD
jgi:hypothetical protein